MSSGLKIKRPKREQVVSNRRFIAAHQPEGYSGIGRTDDAPRCKTLQEAHKRIFSKAGASHSPFLFEYWRLIEGLWICGTFRVKKLFFN
jgi:hypothetical protein